MKRIQEKIKDLIEPHAYDAVRDFAVEPARVLSAYKFTDVTSDLLVRWLDALVSVGDRGAAHALAGARGVGKSHTLAVFGALAGSERLASTVEDAHVAAGAGRLTGRRFKLIRVERGTSSTLAEELATSFAREIGGNVEHWRLEPSRMLVQAASESTDATIVVLIDTAPTRPARVNRDDGPLLSELAQATNETGAFIGLALDDDIAGADGANVALSGSYRIDYLDTEHLYRVADQHVLCKRPQARHTLHEIYGSLRATVSGFNWSELRFGLLYPVHPLVADLSSAVRLFVPDYSFLVFAASVARHAASRPALSLVLLDELFDSVEGELRKSKELRIAFAAFDHLTAESVDRLPVMQRYQARLLLKSLFVMSLDGRGGTARELSAALLLPDDDEQAAGQVTEALVQFSLAALPGSLNVSELPESGEKQYRFANAGASGKVATRERRAQTRASTARTPTSELMQDLESEGLIDGPEVVANSVSTAKSTKASQSKSTTHKTPATKTPPTVSPAPSAPVVDAPKVETLETAPSETETATLETRTTSGASESETVFVSPESDLSTPTRQLDPEELTEWARYLTERPSLGSITVRDGREDICEALAEWLREWRSTELEKTIESLPDTAINTRVWDVGRLVGRRFGAAAEAVEGALSGRIALEDGLVRASEAFDRSPGKLASATRHLAELRDYAKDCEPRERVRSYLARAEQTGVEKIEKARVELLELLADTGGLLERERREHFRGLWREFHVRYTAHYAALHDKTMARGERKELDELLDSEKWSEFEALAGLSVMSREPWERAQELLRRERRAQCRLPIRSLLEHQPSCACSFRLSLAAQVESIPQALEQSISHGLSVYHRTLSMIGGHLAIALDAMARKKEDAENIRHARALSVAFAQDNLPATFSRADVRLIDRALKRSALPPVRVVAPNGDSGLLTRSQLRSRLDSWLNELPDQPVLLELVTKEKHAS